MLYDGVGAVYGYHATVGVALPFFVAVYTLSGVALPFSASVGGLVLRMVPVRYCPSDAASGDAFVGVGVEGISCALVVCSRHDPVWGALGAERFSCVLGVQEFLFGGGEVVVALGESFVEFAAHPGAVGVFKGLGESAV